MSPAAKRSKKGAKPAKSAKRAAPRRSNAKPAKSPKGKASPAKKPKGPTLPERRHCIATDPFGDPCQSAPRLPSKYCTIHSYLDR